MEWWPSLGDSVLSTPKLGVQETQSHPEGGLEWVGPLAEREFQSKGSLEVSETNPPTINVIHTLRGELTHHHGWTD